MKKGLTELVFILDRSGSMMGLESDTVGGYNALLEENRKLEGEAMVTTVLFDHEIKRIHDRVPLERVRNMELTDFQPRGCTALLDAVGSTLADMERVQRILPESHRAEHVLVAIATDGLENASREYDYARVKGMIAAAQERGWEIIFLAANIDAAAEATRMGIRADHAMSYEASPAGTAAMYDAVACASAQVRAGSGLDGWRKRKR